VNHPFLQGGGQLAQIIASYDWSKTALGPIHAWPQSLQTTVALVLRSNLPIVLLMGEDGVMIYNDGYSVFAGGRHPMSLGANVREAWPEIADFNDHVIKVGLRGETLVYKDQELTVHRNGGPEQIWMNLDYSPVLDAAGTPVGVMVLVIETTDKVKAERRLRDEGERMRIMFEQAPGFMAMLSGPDHVFASANPAYMELVGQRQVIGLPVREALPEANSQGFVGLLDKLYASGETWSGTAVPFFLAATGERPARERFLDFVYQPLRDSAGAVWGIFVQGADVTDRVKAEHLLRASEKTFRVLAQTIPSQVWSADADGALDWFNEQVYRYSGTQSGQLHDNRWGEIIHPDDLAGTTHAWIVAVATGRTFETEYRIRRADGAFRWHLVRALPIIGDNGAVQRWVGTSTDIEDQKSTARKLQLQVAERTAERDRMWRYASDVMLVVSLEGWIVAINPAFTRLLGWEEAEVIGTSLYKLIHAEDMAASMAEMASLAEGRHTFKFENRTLRKGGGHAVLSWTAVPDDRYVHAVGRDMTAERAAADEMRRTAAALQQSQKMEAIGKLTGGVAHDFNNLLQVISGNLQLLAADVRGNARAEKRLENALAGVTRGAKLASYLLAFGRRQALDPRVVKIGRFIAGMEDMLRRSLGEEIEVETVISGGLWNTLIDTAQVENAVLNLCINARDAMNGVGKLTIEVGNAMLDDQYADAHPELAAGQYVMIAISDTGAGMSPEVLAQAFDPFFSTKPEGKGSGLGLSMVYGFARQSGGHVKIYSEVGSGTTVKLYLPRSTDVEDLPAPPEMRAVVGGQETILVAEDDEGVRSTVVEMLSELGYRVLKASDAASALSIIDSGLAIDLLFTDVVMPGALRSPELARKARERLPGIAVLFTSGYTENAIVHGGRLDAGVDLLGKPYTREALARKVRHVLANRQHLGQLTAPPAVTMPATPVTSPVTLPAPSQAPAADAAADPAADPAPSAAPAGLRIVLVEDERELRETTTELLELLGHTVLPAGDAAAALAVLEGAAADVMITDISLPDVSGEQLAARARELKPGLRIIFASGQHPRFPLDGAQLLLKPFGIDKLMQMLANV
jgi:PAS domain S-box-containing protein